MRNPTFRPSRLLWGALTAVTVLLAGCAGGDADATADGAQRQAGYVGAPSATAEPVAGGSLTFGSYSLPTVLDPARTQATGSTGGTEMAAIYDTLVRHDFDSRTFVPQLAESLDSSDDLDTYTVTLRPGTRFSDGSVLDARAVKWSIERFVAAKADASQTWTNIVDAIDTPDDRTVVFGLKRPWGDFPVLLSTGAGMIVGVGSEKDGAFSPVGAGPFTVTKFAPREELLLTARDDYIGGRPPLDTLRFLPTAGAQAQYESMRSGQFEMTYILRDEQVIGRVLGDGYAGFLSPTGQNGIGVINSRPGRPGADVRVRQAIAYGVDPEAIDQRANAGLGTASSELVPEGSRWYSGTEGIRFDPDRARQLLDEAKADGFDGHISYLSTHDPGQQATALTVQAALQSVGFDVTVDYATDTTDLVRKVYRDHDFDLTRGGAPIGEEAPFVNLYGSMGSDSRNNATGFADPEMDRLLRAVQTAPTDDDKRNAIGDVQRYANRTVPYVLWGPAAVLTAWEPTVHGVERTVTDIMLLGTAWKSAA
ncbi:ABC transporter substrate-binding protein [Rhodococcus sp. SGAir0479]|uniref:ABC transporter substrate-binding protein n=1 Tax=Rhodococcus sp. SGAir0479 TaxID=2567884 RepID=UPI0010CD4D7C|nr:ABC transporter substrate-binding protein [Rhodococcus sp. SGAir0479]QCQ93217.1 ABC transporter substrate-binding protein [Rhodococcus sp. SGAir0479]